MEETFTGCARTWPIRRAKTFAPVPAGVSGAIAAGDGCGGAGGGPEASLDLEGIPDGVFKDVKRHLTFRNPLHKAMAWSAPAAMTPKITEQLTCWHVEEGILYVARGFAGRLVRILHAHRIKAVYKDQTNKAEDLPGVVFHGELERYQWDVIRDIGDRRFGILTGPIGSGKKVMALYLISQARVPALVVVRHKWQLYQWKEVAEQFLAGVEVGR